MGQKKVGRGFANIEDSMMDQFEDSKTTLKGQRKTNYSCL